MQKEKDDSLKLAKTLCIIFIVFAFCWLPYASMAVTTCAFFNETVNYKADGIVSTVCNNYLLVRLVFCIWYKVARNGNIDNKWYYSSKRVIYSEA